MYKLGLTYPGLTRKLNAPARAFTGKKNKEPLYGGMAWICLLIAGMLEMGWAVGLKYTEGFTRLWPSIWTILCMGVSFFLLSIALKTIPIGTGYAVWTGIGAAGTALIGMLFLGESREVGRILCLMLIVAGIIGLKLFSK